MKKTFAKIKGDIRSSYTIFYAENGMTEQECLEHGYKELIDNPPQCDADEIAVLDRFDESSTTIVMVYRKVKIQPQQKTYIISKYKFIAKLMEMQLWSQVKQMLEDNNLLDLFNAAQELNSNDQFFKQGVQLAKSELGMTDEQIQQFIEQVAV